MAEEIKKLVEVLENVEKNVNDTSSPLKNDDDQNVLGTRLDPKSDKESTEVEITIVVTPININEEEEETTDDGYELRQREKGKQELTKNDLTPSSSTPSSSPPKSKLSATNRLLSIFKAKPGHLRHYKSFFQELQGRYGYLFEHLSTKFMPRWKFNKVAHRLQEIILDSLPKLVDDHILIFLKKQVPLYVERENLCSEISLQVNDVIANQIPSQVDSSVISYMSGHILHVHLTQATPAFAQYQLYLIMKDDPQLQQTNLPIWLALKDKFKRFNASSTSCRPSAVFPRDQEDPHDDALLEGENSAKRQKISKHGTFELGGSSSGQDYESEPGPSTSGNQEQSDDFDYWTNSYATDDDELPTEQVSQELVEEMSQTIDEAKLCKMVDEMLRQQCTLRDEHQYHIDRMQNFLKRGTGLEKIVMSLHKFPAVIFPDDDIEEITSRRVKKCVKKFNPYAWYNFEHWKNPHAKIFYIKKQQETGKPNVISHKFIEEIVARKVCGTSVRKVNLTAQTITFPGIEKYKVFSIVFEPIYGIIYENSKKEKRVDETFIVISSVMCSLSHEDAEYLQLFKERIKE
ncbi:hypothetical protein Tco_0145261 [Tanacetum coccineum]